MLKSAGFDHEPVTFNWDIIDQCQFDCSYCYNRAFNQQKTALTTSAASAYMLVLHRLRTVDVDWNIDVQGGEPTLHPHLRYVVGEMSTMDRCKLITIATNLTKNINYYQELASIDKVEIHMSYHPEYHSGWHNRIQKYASALDTKMFVEVILHPDEKYANDTRKFIDSLIALNIRFGVTLLHATEWFTPTYADELLMIFDDVIRKDNERTKIPHEFSSGSVEIGEHDMYNMSYRGMMCDARMFTIDVDGSIVNTCTLHHIPLRLTKSVLHNRVECPNKKCECSQMLRYKKNEAT